MKSFREVNPCWWVRGQLTAVGGGCQDEDTWGVHLLDANKQGLNLTHTHCRCQTQSRASGSLARHTLSWRHFTSSINVRDWLTFSRPSDWSHCQTATAGAQNEQAKQLGRRGNTLG